MAIPGGDVGLFHFIEFDATFGAVEGNAEALPGGVGGEAVGKLRAVFVAHDEVHGILNANAIAEDILIAKVAVFFFRIEVEAAEAGVFFQIQGEGVAFRGRGARAAEVGMVVAHALSVDFAIECEGAQAEDGSGFAVQPPIDEIEVVGGFMNHESARVAFVAVPAAKIVGAVPGIEEPLEMDGLHFADGAFHDEFLHLAAGWGVAVVEAHAQAASGASDSIQDGAAFGFIGRHRFFGDDIATGFHRADDVFVVGAINGRDDDGVGFFLAEHQVEVSRRVFGDRFHAVAFLVGSVVIGRARGVDIADRGEAGGGFVGLEEGFGEHEGAASGADDDVAMLVALGWGHNRS